MTLSSAGTALNRDTVEQLLLAEGFSHFGFAELKTPQSIGFYEDWLDRGFHGEMAYLKKHLELKREPNSLLKNAHSAIVVTLDYFPHPSPTPDWPLSDASTVAHYARGRDYHHIFQARLGRVIEKLKLIAPNEQFASFADSAPVLERDLAQKAGLGWVGKNTCLISRTKGSLFFIGEIYTTAHLPVARLQVHDHCGTCTRCLDACPTGALVAPRVLDARRCISYLNIESREVPREDLREKISDWLFGCDICQNVCPWNIKLHSETALVAQSNDREKLVADLRFLLSSSLRGLEKKFRGTALMRAGGFGLKRNALVVAGNLPAHEVRPEIEKLLDSVKLSELAQWALERIDVRARAMPQD